MALKTTAQTKEEADEMSVRDRLWDSMNFSYNQKLNNSNAAYDKAISQNDRAMLSRGMQRSSYGAQTRTGLMNQKIDAANAIESEKIADYENRLYQIERDEIEDAFKNKQFDEGVRQYNESLAFQQSEAQRAQQNFEVQQAFQEKQWAAQQDQWKQEFNYTKKSDDQKLAYNYVVQIVAQGKTPSSDLLKRAGLSKSDAKKMQTTAKNSGYYGYSKKNANSNTNTKTPKDSDVELDVNYQNEPGGNGGNPNTITTNTTKAVTTVQNTKPIIDNSVSPTSNTQNKNKKMAKLQ